MFKNFFALAYNEMQISFILTQKCKMWSNIFNFCLIFFNFFWTLFFIFFFHLYTILNFEVQYLETFWNILLTSFLQIFILHTTSFLWLYWFLPSRSIQNIAYSGNSFNFDFRKRQFWYYLSKKYICQKTRAIFKRNKLDKSYRYY